MGSARHTGILLALFAAAGPAAGQGLPQVQTPLPPLVLPVAVEMPVADVPNGVPVSQPLRPGVFVEPAVTAPPEPPAPAGGSPLGKAWESHDVLFWWGKPNPLPPLVTTSRGAKPALGAAGTQTLFGGQPLDSQDAAGLRMTLGWAANDAQTTGIEFTYFFLGTRTYAAAFGDRQGDRYPVVGRPFVNADTGAEDAVYAVFPGQTTGIVNVALATRATGWEVAGVGNLYCGRAARVNVTAGYRYFMLNEGLRVEQISTALPTFDRPTVVAQSADQIDAHNRFHGGQLGLAADLSQGPVFVLISGKVALGRTIEVTRISGQTAVYTAGNPLPLIQNFQAGVLGQPSNTGRLARSAFAVLPEATLKVGCRLGDQALFYVGYNFIYLSDAIRAGDQVDRVVSAGQIPFLPAAGANPFGPDHPRLAVNRSDYWTQGLLFGLEYRY